MGRVRELGTLRGALDRACAGEGGVVALVGAPGIGKTRTARELGELAAERGAIVGWGRCLEGDWSPSYQPWIDALGACFRAAPRSRIRRARGPGAATLAQLVAEAGALVPAGAGDPALPPGDERLRLYDAVGRFLLAIARDPVVLVFDDLDSADRSSLGLLEHAARLTAQAPLLILATYRDVELDLTHPLAQCLAEVNRERRYVHVRLHPLTREETGVLVDGLCGRRVAAAVLDAIYAETGGNPFFVEEVVRHLEEEGLELSSAEVELAELDIPETVRQAVGRRLARLSPETTRLLQVAAAFAGPFDFAVAQAVTGTPAATLLDAVDEALQARMLRPAAREDETYEFAHVIVRHTLYEDLNPSRRARLHRLIARALERVYAGREYEAAAELAYQFLRSASLPGAARGVGYALLAAERARARYAHEEALAFVRLARDLAARSKPAAKADVLCRLAVAEAEEQMIDDALRTLEDALAALAAAGAEDERIAEFLRRVARALKGAGADQAVLRPLVDRGLALVPDPASLTRGRLALLADPFEPVHVNWIAGARWRGFDRAAVELVRSMGDEDCYAETLDAAAPRAREEIAQLLEIVQGWSRPVPKALGLCVAGRALLVRHGAFHEAAEVFAQLLALGEASGLLAARVEALTQLAVVRTTLGDLEAAQLLLERARELTSRLEPAHPLRVEIGLAAALAAQWLGGDWRQIAEEAERVAADRRARSTFVGPLAAGIAAYAHARAGAGADALLEELPAVLERVQPSTLHQNGAAAFGAGAVWELGQAEHAPRYRRLALDLIEAGVGDYPCTSNELTVARMAALLGHMREAETYFARARTSLEVGGQRPLRAVVDYDEALARVRNAGRPLPSSHSSPGALLAEAAAEFESLRMDVWLERAAELARLAAGRTPYPDELTRREVEVLRLLAGGHTNREIAELLVVSVHTVERHLANIYRKIRVRNRAGAAGYALRHGLVEPAASERPTVPI